MDPETLGQRPAFPGYGIATDSDGLLPWSWLADRFARSRNYWVSTTRVDGRPHAMPVWGVWVDDRLVFSTGPESVKGRNLRANPNIVAHVESGDEVGLIEGVAETLTAADAADASDAYEAKYGMRIPDPGPDSVIYRVRPVTVMAWRETDYPRSATCWRFEPPGV